MIPSGALLAIALAAAAADPAPPPEKTPAAGDAAQGVQAAPAGQVAQVAQAAQPAQPPPEAPAAPKPGAKKPPPPPPDDAALEKYRIPVEMITERMVGSASRAVRFDWRKKKVAVAVVAADLLELNNFTSARFGLSARMPIGGFLGEAGLSWAHTWGSLSTERLSLTPYRQVARPRRLELEVNLAYPLAEGVATARPGFFPATELVFSAVAGVRYRYYPGSQTGLDLREIALAVVAPQLSQEEVDNLEGARLPAMEIDRARYGAMVGLSLDVYFAPGGFITPRVMMAPPLLSFGSGLGWWWELTFAAGWMF